MLALNDAIVIALIALGGAVVGSVSTMAVEILRAWLQRRAEARQDQPRKDLLRDMLNAKEFPWRRLETLMHTIGADEDTTKRLLLELGARASEDGQPLWGLTSRNPLPSARQ